MLCYTKQFAEKRSGGAAYLVGDLASKMFDGKFREGHFRLQIQWVVAVVIVTLLEKGVVRRLTSPQQTLSQLLQSWNLGRNLDQGWSRFVKLSCSCSGVSP